MIHHNKLFVLINLHSDPEFKFIFTDAVLDFESITQHPDDKNII
jgi:hypothetical protein